MFSFLNRYSALCAIQNALNYCEDRKCENCRIHEYCKSVFKGVRPWKELYELADKCKILNDRRFLP